MSPRAGALPRTLPELLIWPERAGEYVIGNPLMRTYALGDDVFVRLLSALCDPPTPEQLERDFAGVGFRVLDATLSPFHEGLLGDPTGLDREATLVGSEPIGLNEAIELAQELMLAVDDEAVYEARRGPRKHALDRAHRGTLHQQVGEYVLLDLREPDVDGWWVRQKFTDDQRGPRPGLYRDVQLPFMRAYFDRERLAGRRVLDFGCGPGLFTRLLAANGATVLGLDTNTGHLETGARLAQEDGVAERIEWMELELPLSRGLAHIEDREFDLILLSDVLMFYFHPYDPGLALDPVELLRGLRKLLAAGGEIAVLEPNGTFWQQPWLGHPRRPFTIVTEYRHRRYGVTPTLEQFSRAAEDSGLAITRIRELVPEAADGDRGMHFAAEFPIWWFFELRCRD